MKKLSEQMLRLMERLAEMFPKQHYQSEIERFIASKHPKSTADVEHYSKEFEHRISSKNFI